MQNWKQCRIPINSLCHWVEPAHLWWCKCVFIWNTTFRKPNLDLCLGVTHFLPVRYTRHFFGTLRQKGRTRDSLKKSLDIICMYVCHLLYVVHCLNSFYIIQSANYVWSILFNVQDITDRQERVARFIYFICCGLLETLERNFLQHRKGRGFNLKSSNRVPHF